EGVPEALTAIADTIADNNGQRQSIANQLANLKCPVLLIWGDQDQIVPVPQAADLPANAKLTIIQGTGHMPQMEAASSVNSQILNNIGQG
ncbi:MULTISPECIES: alpha/beta fold hydrolase, partial [unclassified Mesorhizobium]|uniref:alpha/beta fold hydrolase n=1 Tax=unclassified Mesorhizobium TaxID=325217 RepID=UPI001092284A